MLLVVTLVLVARRWTANICTKMKFNDVIRIKAKGTKI